MKRFLLSLSVCILMAGCSSVEDDTSECNPSTFVPSCMDNMHYFSCLQGTITASVCPNSMLCVNGICMPQSGTNPEPNTGECVSTMLPYCEGSTSVTCVNGQFNRMPCANGCANGVCLSSGTGTCDLTMLPYCEGSTSVTCVNGQLNRVPCANGCANGVCMSLCIPRCDGDDLIACDNGVENRVSCANGCANAACLEGCIPRCEGSNLIYCVDGAEQTKPCEKGCADAACIDSAVCGNDRIETGELCDGRQLGDFDCYDVEGVDSRASYAGAPECNSTCNGVTLGTCEMTQCGNGKLQQEADEKCEFDASGNAIFWPGSAPKCEDLLPGTNYTWLEGTPGCSKDCKSYSYGTCVMAPQPLFGINSCHFVSLEMDKTSKSMIGMARIKPREDATLDLLKGRLACGQLSKPTYEWKQYEGRFTECPDCAVGEYEMVADFSYEFISAGTHYCVFQTDLNESDLPNGSKSTEYVNCPIVYGNPHPQKAVSDAVLRTYEIEEAKIDGTVLAHWNFSKYVKDDREYTVGADAGVYRGASLLTLSDNSQIRMLSKSDTTDASASGHSWSMDKTLNLDTTKHFVFRTKTTGYKNIRFQFNVAGSGIHQKNIMSAIKVLGIVFDVGSKLEFSDQNTFHAYPLTTIPNGSADDASEMELRIYTWGVPDVNATVRIDDIYIIGDAISTVPQR